MTLGGRHNRGGETAPVVSRLTGDRPSIVGHRYRRRSNPSEDGSLAIQVSDAIRKRRAVRDYTDRPVPDDVLERLLRLALSAPTGSGAQAWSLVVVREERSRQHLAELIIDGGTRYFDLMRPRREGVSAEEHYDQAAAYAERVLGSYRQVPVWILGVMVPTREYPGTLREWGRDDDLMSLAFAMENLMVAARGEGLGTVPTTAFMRFHEEAVRSLLELPEEVHPALITPLGYPRQFPKGTPPAMRKTFTPWDSLVHDERWGRTRDRRAAAAG